MRPLLLTMLAVALALTAACRDPADPETQVRAVIDRVAAAAENRDVGTIMAAISEQYSDHEHRTKADLFMYAQLHMNAVQSVRVTYRIAEVSVSGDVASARVVAGLADGPIISPDTRADVYSFDLRFERDGSDWLVQRVSWEPSTVGALLGG